MHCIIIPHASHPFAQFDSQRELRDYQIKIVRAITPTIICPSLSSIIPDVPDTDRILVISSIAVMARTDLAGFSAHRTNLLMVGGRPNDCVGVNTALLTNKESSTIFTGGVSLNYGVGVKWAGCALLTGLSIPLFIGLYNRKPGLLLHEHINHLIELTGPIPTYRARRRFYVLDTPRETESARRTYKW